MSIPSKALGSRPGRWFAWSEFQGAPTECYPAIAYLVGEALDPWRDDIGRPLVISEGGGWRSEAHNAEIPNAAENSLHLYGLGADVVAVSYRLPSGVIVPSLSSVELAATIPAAVRAKLCEVITYKPPDRHTHVAIRVGRL